MERTQKRGVAVLLGGLAALLLVVPGWNRHVSTEKDAPPGPHAPLGRRGTPSPAPSPQYTEAPPLPEPKRPSYPLRYNLLYINASGPDWSGGRQFMPVTGGPPGLEELDRDSPLILVVPPSVVDLDALPFEVNDLAWAMTGWSPWTDQLVLRTAAYSSIFRDDPQALADVQAMLDDAATRWPGQPAFRALGWVAGPREGLGDRVRAEIDRWRSEPSPPTWAEADAATSIMVPSSDPSSVRDDHERLVWLAHTFPGQRGRLAANDLHLALEGRLMAEAASWMDLLERLPDEELERAHFRNDELRDYHFALVAIGARPAVSGPDRVAAAVGRCMDTLTDPRSRKDMGGVQGRWDGGAWSWVTNAPDVPWATELAACLDDSSVPWSDDVPMHLQVWVHWESL